MNPLLAMELETRTLVQLYVLARLIETILVENEEPPEERRGTFANRELVRRELSKRHERGR
jgi:hypothetical protein